MAGLFYFWLRTPPPQGGVVQKWPKVAHPLPTALENFLKKSSSSSTGQWEGGTPPDTLLPSNTGPLPNRGRRAMNMSLLISLLAAHSSPSHRAEEEGLWGVNPPTAAHPRQQTFIWRRMCLRETLT